METTKRIKVLFITKWFMNRHDPQLGVFIRKHASAAAMYNDVALLCVLSDVNQKNKIEIEEQDFETFSAWIIYFRKFNSSFSILNSVVNFFRYLSANRKGLKIVRKKFGKHDVTHAYILLRPALTAWWLRLTEGIPFLISEQWSGYATGKFRQKNFFIKYASRLVFKKADAVTAVSEFLKSKMIAEGLINNYTITPNIIEQIEKKSSPLPANNKIKILTVADLDDEIKNISDIIKVIASIASTNDEIEFHLIGHGKDEDKLKNLARETGLLGKVIFFHGVKTNEEVFQYLYACQFLVVNSRFETFSLICVEAMYCGKPVIATRCGGPEQFINSNTGLLIDIDAPEQLQKAIEKMISDYSGFNHRLLRDYALVNFSAEDTGKKFSEIYQKLARR